MKTMKNPIAIKYVACILVIMSTAGTMTQCKKKSPLTPPGEDSVTRLVPGARYIIRTRYICADRGGFVLASQSNFELIKWMKTRPEDVEWQKTADDYTWTALEFRSRSDIGPGTVHMGFGFYQRTPGGGYMMLGTSRPSPAGDDLLGHGNGPTEQLSLIGMNELPDTLIGAVSSEYAAAHPEYFEAPSVIFSIRSPTDSTYRMVNSGKLYTFNGRSWPDWWVSVSARPDGSNCDDYRYEPVMRKEITGVGCTFIPDPDRPYYIPDVCYITQLVFEKAD